ncbi:MAG: hypothetical protein E7358_03930 [Clostridiales bacterium]|nr:hypothetical protein [Clostridiales bacterium]
MKKLIAILTLIICILCFPACKQGGETLSVYAPDGAPALSLSYAINSKIDGVDFRIVGADVIKTKVSGNEKKADVAILPINDATKLLGSGEEYKLLGIVTHGNFYLLSKDNLQVDRENASVLIGKTIGVVQLAKIPGLTLKASLKRLNLEYNELKNGVEKVDDKVNLLAINPTEIGNKDVDYYLCPSPVADLKAKTHGLNFVGSLASLYNENGFPQAVIVAKKSVIIEDFEKLNKIIDKISDCENYLIEENFNLILQGINSHLEEGLTPSFNQNNLTKLSVERSKINYISAIKNKQIIEEFISIINEISPNVMGNISQEFYYNGDF